MNSKEGKYFICTVIDYASIWQCVGDTRKTIRMIALEETLEETLEEALLAEKSEILIQEKDNNCKHSWRNYGDDFVIYPNRAGIPYHFEPLTRRYLEDEILDCNNWGVSNAFYLDLLNKGFYRSRRESK